MNDQKLREALVGRGITLNTLRDQQFSLNRQMLQERIQAQLAEIQTEIDRITLRQ